MVATDIAILVGFSAMWLKVSSLCFNHFPCPDHLNPKNNNGKKSKRYYDYYGNYVSICHAVVAMILSSYVLITEGLSFGIANTLAVKIAVYNSFVYFLYDTIISEYHRYNTPAMTFHHIGAVLSCAVICYTQANGAEFLASLLIAEVSNPFNLYREIMKHNKQESSKLYFKFSLTFASLFIISRFGFFPYLLTKFYPSPSNVYLKVMLALVWFVSWHWLFVIFNFAVKEIKVFSESSQKKTDQTNTWNSIYLILSSLRKNKTFLIAFYVGAAWLSFGTLYLSHRG
jgi:hypothetical protein